MSINLKKGGSFNLTKEEPGLKKIMFGLGWEVKQGNSLDLDASVFLVNSSGKLPNDNYFVFYNNLKSPDGSIQHTGDNRSGFGDDDDEMILCNLDLVDASVSEILVTVSIHEAETRRHNFGLLADAYIRLYDVENKKEILRYDLDSQNSYDAGMIFGKLQRQNNEWKFYALGEGNAMGGLRGFVEKYA
ncbi:MAG: TerD family protein [Cytophagales bacterium]